MLRTNALVFAFLLGFSAVSFARVDIGKALGRVSLATNSRRVLGGAKQFPLKINARVPQKTGNLLPDVNESAPRVVPGVTSPPPAPTPRASPCQTAAQWEGRASEWDHLQGNNNRFNISFDGTNRRKRIMEDKHAQLPGKRIYEYIMLFDEGIQYVVNHNYNTCTVEPIGTWRNHTIPPNATLEDRYEIGAPGSGVMVQEWSDRIPGRQKEGWIGTFTDPGCWPLTETFVEKDSHNTIVQSLSTRFFDLSAGIKDISIFTPPPYCHHATHAPETSTQSSAAPRTLASQPSRRVHPDVPRRTRPIVPRIRPELSGNRLLGLAKRPRTRPEVPRNWPEVPVDLHRAIVAAIKSGDHRQLPEGMDWDTINRKYEHLARQLG